MRKLGLVLLLALASPFGVTKANDVKLDFRIENAAGERTDVFDRKDVARLVFCVHNEGAEAVQLSYTFPPHRAEVTAVNSGEPVWQAHYGQMFMQVMKEETLAAGEKVEFTVEWDFHHSETPDKPVPPGEYEVHPEFHAFVGDGKLPSKLPVQQISVRE